MKKRNLFVLALTVVGSMAVQAQQVKRVFIKDNTTPCTGVAPMDCLNVKFESERDWQLFYSGIENFNYEPGFQYELLVTETVRPASETPADASTQVYKLKKVVNKTAADAAVWNYKWSLTQLEGEAVKAGLVTAEFDAATNSIFGKSGCNNYNMSVVANKKRNKITTKAGIGTLMACNEELMKLEQQYTAALADKKMKLEVHQGELSLISKGKTIMKFKKYNDNAKEVNQSALQFISDKKWKLIQINNVSSTDLKQTLYLDINNKKVNGNAGCNNYFGALSITGSAIQFGPLGTTRMACRDAAEGQLENDYLNILQQAGLSFDIADQTLNIYKDNKIVLMFGLTN